MPIWYGGDYNPEQWPKETWAEDVSLMNRAGVTMATVAVFAWSKIEPVEGHFEWEWLDRVMDGLHEGGIRVDLATATASPPPWLSTSYPETLPVTETGMRVSAGARQHYCPSSPVYRKLAARLTRQIAERYASHPALEMWHINNEFGCHISRCYCEVSSEAFREWLKAKYGSIGALNHAWGTAFWSQTYSDFSQISAPSVAAYHRNPTQLLDFERFSSSELLECFRSEASIVRDLSPGVLVTTNFMGFFKAVNYWEWIAELDVISDDSYPDPADPDSPAFAAMTRDLMRSLGRGRPWMLMEQATGAVNSRARNTPRRPGELEAMSYQAVARGADAILFFQWRQSVAGVEKFHSAMLPHAGVDSRTFREVEKLGAELAAFPPLGDRSRAEVAIILDWDSWWSIEQRGLPSTLSYVDQLFQWYRSLYGKNVVCDFVRATDDLSAYRLVVAPHLFVLTNEAAENLDGYVRAGGHLVVTYQSGITDENSHLSMGGYLASLAHTLGIRVEEFIPLANPDRKRTDQAPPPAVRLRGDIESASGGGWAEVLQLTTARATAWFDEDYFAGSPAITENDCGEGTAHYVATDLDSESLDRYVSAILTIAEIAGLDGGGLEVVDRGDWRFLINHASSPVEVAGHLLEGGAPLLLSERGATVVRRPQ